MAITYRIKAHAPTAINWADIRDEYIEQNLVQEDKWTLRQVSELYSINYGTVRNHAAKEGWNAALEGRRASDRANALEILKEAKGVFNEVEVRVRQSRFGRRMAALGMQKLANLDADDLTIPQAIEMLRVGMGEERRALGMPDRFEFVGIPGTEEREEHLRALDELIAALEHKHATIEGDFTDVSTGAKTAGVFEIEPAGNPGDDSTDAGTSKKNKGDD
jgi:hypothetical protein